LLNAHAPITPFKVTTLGWTLETLDLYAGGTRPLTTGQ